MSIRVEPVRTRRDREDFIALPFKLYERDPSWIGPSRASVRRAMDADANPFRREAFVEHFIARDVGGACVGRVAAIIHPAHMRRHGQKAFFGCFEAIDAPDVARGLLSKVEAWADERGVRVVQGPCSYTMTQEAGLLVEGFDQPPVLLQSHNPPYYATLLRAASYEPAFHMSTYRISRESEAAKVAGARSRGDAAARLLGLSARSIDMKKFGDELEQIRLCYNASFVAHPETAPISREVFADQAGEMKSIVDPELVRIVEKQGRPVGFSVAVPNVYELLAPTRGRLTLSLLLRWQRLLRRVRSLVVIMIGGDPQHDAAQAGERTAYGLGTCLAAQVAHALNGGGYETVHTTWIHERNWRARALMRAIGAKQTKLYGIFQKEVA